VAGTLAILVGVAAAPALPGGDTPLFESGGLGRDGKGQTYSTEIPPLLDVGDKLRQGAERELFTVGADRPEYWRITALDEYRSRAGGQWTLEARGEDAVGEGLDQTVPDDALHQEYAIGELGERWMPAAYRPVRVSRSETLVVRASSTLVTTEQSVAGLRYRVDSALPVQTLTAEQRQRAARAAPRSLARYMELPADFPASVRTEAARVTAGLTSPVDKAQALRDYFRDGSFVYDPGVELGDDQAAIERFLVARRGFCVQFASAYATMARAVGLPTRIAVGFTPGRQQADGLFHVTNWDAHAWPEVWLAGFGWTHLFDPTPPSADPGGSNLPSEPPVTPPTPTPQTETAPPQTVPPPPDSQTSGAPSPTTPQGQGVTVDRSATPDGDDSSSDLPWIVLFLLVLACIVATPVLAVVLLKHRRRRRRRSVSDPSDAIEGAWLETLDELVDRRVRWPASDTPRELARRVPGVTSAATARPMRELAETYGAVHYGERAPSRAQADGAWRNADELRAALASSAPFLERARARLNPSRLGRRSRHE
jgi:transglutaminase-like putative cysteine protease